MLYTGYETESIISIFNTRGVRGMEQQLFDLIFQKETIFFGLFLFLFWEQRKDAKKQQERADKRDAENKDFIQKQQELLSDLTRSIESIDEDLKEIKHQIKGAV